jgi:pyrophosphatase PpaX
MSRPQLAPCLCAVLFDLDGTLLDSFEQHWHSWVAAITSVGSPAPTRAMMRKLDGLPVLPKFETLNVPRERVPEVMSRKLEEMKRWAHLATPFPGVLALLDQLRSVGLPVGIVTSRPRASVDVTPAALEVGFRAKVLVTRDDTDQGKPHPAPVLCALQRLAIPAERALYVGDTRFDLEAGRRAGCLTALATWQGVEVPLGGELPPEFVFSSPGGLAELLLDSQARSTPG